MLKLFKLNTGENVVAEVGEGPGPNGDTWHLRNPMIMLVASAINPANPNLRHDKFILRDYAMMCEETEMFVHVDDLIMDPLTPNKTLIAAYRSELLMKTKADENALEQSILAGLGGAPSVNGHEALGHPDDVTLQDKQGLVTITIAMPRDVFVMLAEDGFFDNISEIMNGEAPNSLEDVLEGDDEDDDHDDDDDDDEEEDDAK